MQPNKRIQILAAVSWVVLYGAWSIYTSLNPDPRDLQAVADVRYHPLASALGALTPSIVLAPIVYWMFGLALRQTFRRFVVREYEAFRTMFWPFGPREVRASETEKSPASPDASSSSIPKNPPNLIAGVVGPIAVNARAPKADSEQKTRRNVSRL
jgi:hypothetical protein